MKFLNYLALAGISLPTLLLASDACPTGIELQKERLWRWKWKEDYGKRKLASLKLKRERYGMYLNNKISKGELSGLPDYSNGWTLVIEFDRPVTQGIFQVSHGRFLSSNMEGTAIAFTSHDDNRLSVTDRQEVLRPWFELTFLFDEDEPTFDFTKVSILEGEFANVQCMFTNDANNGYASAGIVEASTGSIFDPFNNMGDSASMMAIANQVINIVNHQDSDSIFLPNYGGVKPFEMGGHYMDQIYNQGPKCDNGVADWKSRCYDVIDTCADGQCDSQYSKDDALDQCLYDDNVNTDACNCNSKSNREVDMSVWKECGNGPSCSSCDEVYYVPSANACPVDEETIGHIWGADCNDMDDTLLTVCDMRPAFNSGTKEIELEADDPWTFNRVHSNAFTEHLDVEYLLMEDNLLVQDLPSDVFALNTKLDFVDLENMNLNHIDEDLFKNNDLLEKVYLHNNNIETIDEQVFNVADNPVLSIVKLANNPIWRSEADNDLPQSQKDDLFDVARNIEFP